MLTDWNKVDVKCVSLFVLFYSSFSFDSSVDTYGGVKYF